MVPEGWVKIRLGSIAELQRGFDLPSSQRVDGCVPIVSSGGVTGYHNEAKSKAPGVVTGRYGSIGDVFYLEEDYWPLNTSLWVKDFHGNHEKFIYYLLSNFDFKKFSDKTGVPGVNRNDLHAVKVGLPPLPEQKKIAKILSTWDKAITTTEQLLTNSQQQKKALMQQLLTGKKRLLDKNGVRFSGEWKTYKFGSLFNERVETGRDDLPLLSITADDGVVYQEDTGRKNTSNEDKSKYRRICVNDIGYNTMRMWQGRSSLSDKEGIVSPAYTIVTPTGKVCPAYAAYLFKFPALVHIFYRHSQGLVSDTWNLKFNHFKKISWQVPSIDEQQKIAAVLSTADKEVTAQQQKLDALKQEKKALMQQLLTGKRRVKVEEVA
ncbi:restriction endonuclease subunit S [Aeromonas veronii]|uniref:restriction endonuclease subunit S n=1 Tax=Aeromonas veronii TaxID=654 RepID=UPI00366C1E5D